jgi:hypothetical protein
MVRGDAQKAQIFDFLERTTFGNFTGIPAQLIRHIG